MLRRLAGAARAALVLVLVALGTSAFVIRAAEARVGEALHGFASELLGWKAAKFASAPRTLQVNGSNVHFVSAATALELPETLNRFEALCRDQGDLAGVERALSTNHSAQEHSAIAWLHGVFREESTSEGFVACLATGTTLTPTELARRLAIFSVSGDLADLGALRYALVRRQHNETTALIFWSEGSFPLLHMFPAHGDAPGVDPTTVPRPQQSDRLLSASEHDTPYSLAAYRLSVGAPQALESYLAQLRALGWSIARKGSRAAVGRQGDRTVVISAHPTGPAASTLSLFELS